MVAGEIARPVDVLVIGGGPGGYTAAARAVELGRQVVLVESERLGGTCLNVGCIPSKALITVAHDLDRARHRVEQGIGLVGQVDVDLGAARRWKDGVVGRLRDGVATLLRGVEVVQGTARFVARDRVAVEAQDHVEHLQFHDAIIATGSRPAELASLPFDHTRILDSTDALALTEVPDDLVVVGGGYIGVELGTAFAHLGSRVTIVEVAESILAEFDPDVVDVVRTSLDRLGVVVRTGDDGPRRGRRRRPRHQRRRTRRGDRRDSRARRRRPAPQHRRPPTRGRRAGDRVQGPHRRRPPTAHDDTVDLSPSVTSRTVRRWPTRPPRKGGLRPRRCAGCRRSSTNWCR